MTEMPPTPPGFSPAQGGTSAASPIPAPAQRRATGEADGSGEAASFRGLALKLGNYLVDDLHIKAPVLLCSFVLGYGYLVKPELLDNCKEFAAYISAGLIGVAVTSSIKK